VLRCDATLTQCFIGKGAASQAQQNLTVQPNQQGKDSLQAAYYKTDCKACTFTGKIPSNTVL